MITELDLLLARFGLWDDGFYELPMFVPEYEPLARPRPAQPWELRPQVASAATLTRWQRCPERHRHRESRQRWQRESA